MMATMADRGELDFEQLRARVDDSASGTAADALRRVLDLHRPVGMAPWSECPECTKDEYNEPWPCDTVTAIAEALGLST